MNGKYSNKSLPMIEASRFVLLLPGVPLVNEFIGSETLPYIRKKPYAPTILPFLLWLVILLLPLIASAQSDQHYTMFMYNKLLYNPAYTGSRDVTSVNADYRDQWNNIDGAPKTANISIDAPVGSYMKTFRKVAVGFSLTNETLGVENNTTFKAYYAYRIKFNKFILSLGLSGGGDLYSANYSKLHRTMRSSCTSGPNIQRPSQTGSNHAAKTHSAETLKRRSTMAWTGGLMVSSLSSRPWRWRRPRRAARARGCRVGWTRRNGSFAASPPGRRSRPD